MVELVNALWIGLREIASSASRVAHALGGRVARRAERRHPDHRSRAIVQTPRKSLPNAASLGLIARISARRTCSPLRPISNRARLARRRAMSCWRHARARPRRSSRRCVARVHEDGACGVGGLRPNRPKWEKAQTTKQGHAPGLHHRFSPLPIITDRLGGLIPSQAGKVRARDGNRRPARYGSERWTKRKSGPSS